MLTAQQVAHALNGKPAGRDTVRAPGPGHSRHDDSLIITIRPDAPDGFLVHSHSGDDWQLCRDHVRAALGIPFEPSGSANWRMLKQGRQICRPSLNCGNVSNPENIPERDVTKPANLPEFDNPADLRTSNLHWAERCWAEAEALPGTIAEAYLCRRLGGAAIPADVIAGGQLRFHRTKCMLVARMVDPLTGAFVGAHRTFLSADGHKLDRKMLGGSGVVRLIDPEAHGEPLTGLAIGEGLESTLAALVRYQWRPIWAAMTANNLRTLPFLKHVEALTIFGDHDIEKNGQRAGTAAALECAARWHAAGAEAAIFTPSAEASDFGDKQGNAA